MTRIHNMVLAAGALFLASHAPASGQVRDTGQPVALPESRSFNLHSAINGRDYRILVVLPEGYTSGSPGDTTHYPVLYLADGELVLPVAFYAHRTRLGAGTVRNVLLVGIGFPWEDRRKRRLEESTPVPNLEVDSTSFPPERIHTGRAPELLKVLEREIIPFIDRTYRVTEERAFIGTSLSGLFAAYALFENPTLFRHWVLESPSLWWANRWISERESQYAATHRDLPANVYLWVGASADMTTGTLSFADRLEHRNYRSLKLQSDVIVGGTHMTSWHDGIVRALETIFPKTPVQRQ